MKKYKLTEEHRKQLKPWADKWIKNALSTRKIEDHEKPLIREYVKKLYQAANLTPPPDHRIVFVDSPFIARVAGGFAAWVWYCRKNKLKNTSAATSDATYAATDAATRSATDAATYDATRDATYAATYDATRSATDAATRDATRSATYNAMDDATRSATDDATYDATRSATRDATYAATDAATRSATDAATRDATRSATDDATYAATRSATYAATYDATYDATDDAMHAATSAATDAATRSATDDATYAATYDATDDAMHAATDDATYDATYAATYDATYDATRSATDDATDDATYAATDEATEKDTEEESKNWYYFPCDIKHIANLFGGKPAIVSVQKSWRLYQGGNFWSPWVCFLSFFRHIVKLPIDYSKFDCYEKLAELSSYRIVHEKFCIISERPETLKIDDQNRPHCDDGPFCKWRDGSMLFAIHGVRVPMWVVMNPERITIEKIQNETDLEVQRIMIERYGVDKYLIEIGATVIDTDFRGIDGGGARCLMREKNGRQWLVCTDGSTERVYHLAVPENVTTCKQAHEELCGFDESLITMEG